MKQQSMIASSVLESDAFLSMPLSAQALYCHLQLYADSMGALDSVTIPLRSCGASDEDLSALYDGGWLIKAGGVPFITDWLVHNSVREKDQHTRHPDELAMLEVSKGHPYRLKRRKSSTNPGPTQGRPSINPGPTTLKKEITKERSYFSGEPPAQVGGGGGPLEDALCPACSSDFLSGPIGSRHCFSCNFTEGGEAGEGQ